MSTDLINCGNDPQVGNLSTPVNGSAFTKAFINALPAYRQGLSANRRGLEIGMAHGYLLYGPFAVLGPLRLTDYGPTAGLLATIGLVSILTICLSIYGAVGVGKPTETLTTPNVPLDLASKEGWSEFAGGFLLGACGGAFFAYFLCQTPHLKPLIEVASGVWSS
ncbi:photosystem I subunit XI PsaL [Geminocystis sp. NIES-3708]|uniref:photosystem I reaction center subunit XI n=1 Tax=Geminocystis sp. NIES-3708 TaxID=1615909 RepID=UPI0005FC6C93|nr:photosystem I reaction center subunit XI [Geminocystis sp. NIES-3708]BAQ60865.1 photosystem I subunit XI PsaL [Geminocystis sp. NIES-3708]